MAVPGVSRRATTVDNGLMHTSELDDSAVSFNDVDVEDSCQPSLR